MISIKQLQYALAVAETLHFKRAAEQCAVSQSALSTAISELESQLGVQIFERDNKKVFITPLGEQFIAKSREIKAGIDDLYRLANAQKAPLSYPMTVGVIPTIGPFLLPKVLPEVRHSYPNFELKLVEEQSHVLVEMVRKGEIDTAILALPYDTTGLHVFEFWEEDFYIVGHKDVSLLKNKEVDSARLMNEKLLLLKDGHCLKDHALAACKMANSETASAVSATSLYTLIQMVAGKMGVTFVPQMALDQLAHTSSELIASHLSDPGPHRKIAFITRLNYAGVTNIELLMKIFKEQLWLSCR